MKTGMPNVAERREVGEVAPDDAVGVVGRAGECERDGHGFFRKAADDGPEPFDHRRETLVEVLGVRRERDRLHDESIGLHGSEHEVRAAGVEGDHHPVVMAVHIA